MSTERDLANGEIRYIDENSSQLASEAHCLAKLTTEAVGEGPANLDSDGRIRSW